MTRETINRHNASAFNVEDETYTMNTICGETPKACGGCALTPSEYWNGLRTILRRAHNELICFYSDLDAYRDDSEAVALRLKIETVFLHFSGEAGLRTVKGMHEFESIRLGNIYEIDGLDIAAMMTEDDLRGFIREALEAITELARYLKRAKTRN